MEKPGYKTTEATGVLAMILLTAVNAKFGLEISDEMLMTLSGLVGTYVASRSWAKAKAAVAAAS